MGMYAQNPPEGWYLVHVGEHYVDNPKDWVFLKGFENVITAIKEDAKAEQTSAERRGKWIDSGKDWLNCSVCDEPVRKVECDKLLRNDSYYHYCPNCGARMER